MWLLDSLLRSIVCAACFCLMGLQLSNSTENNINNDQIATGENNGSLGEHVLHTPNSNSVNTSTLVQRPNSQLSNGDESNSFQEEQHIQPTPLMLHLNGSAIELLLRETNNMFVSNTSFSDLVSDNETQQMLLRYRERKRHERILTIQRDILQMLGLTKGPNVTARLSAEERQSLVRSFGRTMIERTADNETVCADDDYC